MDQEKEERVLSRGVSSGKLFKIPEPVVHLQNGDNN